MIVPSFDDGRDDEELIEKKDIEEEKREEANNKSRRILLSLDLYTQFIRNISNKKYDRLYIRAKPLALLL